MRRSVVVSTLGITQTLAWGSTYYLAAVFADPISDTLQLPHVWFFAIFSASLLLSGLLGPLAGRMIDKHGGRDVLAATNLVFAAGLVCLSFASGIFSLTFAWALIGIGMGFGLYEAAFATAAGLYGREARNAITGITLFAGFAKEAAALNIVVGVNDHLYEPAKHRLLTAASCTTNCLAPS
jgi:MFS family permease